MVHQYPENGLRECLQNFESLEMSIQFAENLRRRVILKQSLHWDVLQDHFSRRLCFEIEHQHAESIHTLVQTKIPEKMPQFHEEQQLDQSFKFTSHNFLAVMDLKFRSWVVICRGKNRFADELHLQNPGHNLTSSELLSERAIAKEGELCSTELEQSLHRGNSRDATQDFHTRGIGTRTPSQ